MILYKKMRNECRKLMTTCQNWELGPERNAYVKNCHKWDGDLTFSEESRRIICGRGQRGTVRLGKKPQRPFSASHVLSTWQKGWYSVNVVVVHAQTKTQSTKARRFSRLWLHFYFLGVKSSRERKNMRATMARRSLESKGRHERCQKHS